MRRAQLIKNVRLKSVVELFTDADSGIGQFDIEDLSKEFQWDVADPPNDLTLIRKLVLLPSYESIVYISAYAIWVSILKASII